MKYTIAIIGLRPRTRTRTQHGTNKQKRRASMERMWKRRPYRRL